jgi:SAM-dependent MidA family methyltransferase
VPADLADRIRRRIEESGPIPVAEFVDLALYDPAAGFYASGGQAGRRGDFLTSPEVGPLFGAVISQAVDRWWRELGEPDEFVVAEHGAGPGTLARTVTVAGGACLGAGALQWVMVEPSDEQRRSHPDGDHLRSVSVDDAVGRVDLVLANELFDNLAFAIVVRRSAGWVERRVSLEGNRFALVDGPPTPAPMAAETAVLDVELPVPSAALAWVERQRSLHPNARIVALDYAAPTRELADRAGGWLRAYRQHERIVDWLDSPGTCDITIDLPLEPLAASGARVQPQADFLRHHGIDDLVAEGRRVWEERAAVGGLAALRARSRVVEAEALLDPDGLGGFTVLEWAPAGS